MSVHKRKRNGKVTWLYKYDVAGSSRGKRETIREYGFETKQAAMDAETARRKMEEEKKERAASGDLGRGDVPRARSMRARLRTMRGPAPQATRSCLRHRLFRPGLFGLS